MKKIIYPFIALMLSACSFNDVIALIVTPTPFLIDSPVPELVYTPTYTPTITPTPPTPTFTLTPTLMGVGSTDENAPLFTPFPTSTQAPQISLFGSSNSLLVSMSVSSDILYWGYCEDPHYVDFDVRLANNLPVLYSLAR